MVVDRPACGRLRVGSVSRVRIEGKGVLVLPVLAVLVALLAWSVAWIGGYGGGCCLSSTGRVPATALVELLAGLVTGIYNTVLPATETEGRRQPPG